jgi:hypothetical protein
MLHALSFVTLEGFDSLMHEDTELEVPARLTRHPAFDNPVIVFPRAGLELAK